MGMLLARRGSLAKQTVSGGGGSDPATGTAFVSDSMTGTDGDKLGGVPNHVGETGASWSIHPVSAKDLVISDANRCRNNDNQDFSGQDAIAYASGVPTTAEYDVTGVLYRVASSNGETRLLARLDTAALTGYGAVVEEPATLRLYKFSAAAVTELASTPWTAVTGGLLVVRFQVRDATKKVFTQASEASKAVTAAAATDLFTSTGHGYSAGDEVRFTGLAGGAGITSDETPYFVIASGLTANEFKVSTTLGGSSIDVTSDLSAGRVARFVAAESEALSSSNNDITTAGRAGIQMRNIQDNTKGLHVGAFTARNV